jgi:hypothetical protein
LHVIQEHIKVNNFGKDHHAKFILEQKLGSCKVETFYHGQQSHLVHFCYSLILKIPPPHLVVSGHLQLNQTHYLQILNPFKLNQIWAKMVIYHM